VPPRGVEIIIAQSMSVIGKLFGERMDGLRSRERQRRGSARDTMREFAEGKFAHRLPHDSRLADSLPQSRARG
jgi:hypothetical protein